MTSTASANGIGPRFYPSIQRFAFVMGHRDVESLAGFFVRLSDLVDGANVGVVESRGGFCLDDQPLSRLFVGAQKR